MTTSANGKTLGRPRTHSREAIARLICYRVAQGELVTDVCKDIGITRGMLHKWGEQDTTIRDAFARARVSQAHAMMEDTILIADGLEEGGSLRLYAMVDALSGVDEKDKQRLIDSLQASAVARDRLRVDTRKWATSKIAPKIYGDHSTQEVTGSVVVEHNVAPALQASLAARLAGIASRRLPSVSASVVEDASIVVDDAATSE